MQPNENVALASDLAAISGSLARGGERRFRLRRPISLRLANCAGDIIVLKCTRRHKCTIYSYHSHTPVGRLLDTTGES
ncbi:unnamed protein product, partial [Brenthis ino]